MQNNDNNNNDDDRINSSITRFIDNHDWVKQNFSSLEVVLMAKANLARVKHFHEKDPSALTVETFRNVCQNGCQPGALTHLAKQFPPRSILQTNNQWDLNPIDLVMSQGPGPDRPSEDDISELINLCPESVSPRKGELSHRAWDFALLGGHSFDLISFMARKLALQKPTVASFNVYKFDPFEVDQAREEIDTEIIDAVAPLFPPRFKPSIIATFQRGGQKHGLNALNCYCRTPTSPA